MDIHKEWEQLNHKLFSNQSLKHEEIMKAITSESSSAIAGIKKGLRIKSYWCLLFTSLLILLMIYSRDNIESVIAISVVAVLYAIGFFLIRNESNRMDSILDSGQNVLGSMKANAKIIKRAINIEIGIFAYGSPVLLICGMFYGRFLKGHTFHELMQDPKFLTIIIGLTIVAVPLVYLTGMYLNKKAFGVHMKELDTNINKLEGIELVKSL